ncbi:methyltransferase domain-containing protein [Desulfotomaculum nigrificans]|uniref:methyltransferase domain-containing protein n=1 Tax=Desulfotomaculum nigrificans TaxID=1565 RepID=UPI0001FAEB07
MEKVIYLKMVQMERNHWWYKGRREFISKLIRPYLRPNLHILDAGCGAGGTMEYMARYGSVVGIDISEEMVEYCRKEGLSAYHGSVTKLPFANGLFDLVLCLDVLEHLPMDQIAVEELKRVIRPGGLLVISVPSFSWLWGRHDELNQHCRRYNFGELIKLVQLAGLSVERSTYFNFFLLPPIWLARKLGRLLPMGPGQTDLNFGTVRLNTLLYSILKLEAELLGKFNLPIGVSQVVLARKK